MVYLIMQKKQIIFNVKGCDGILQRAIISSIMLVGFLRITPLHLLERKKGNVLESARWATLFPELSVVLNPHSARLSLHIKYDTPI